MDEPPWVPRSGPERPGDTNDLGAPDGSDGFDASYGSDGPEGADVGIASETTLLLGSAVVLLALAGICALAGGQFLLGFLRLEAGILAGAGLGALLLALLPSVIVRPRPRLLLAGGVALAVTVALTVPAVVSTRVPPLQDAALLTLDALEDGDVVHSVPGAGTPILVRRADGTGQLLGAGTVTAVDAAPDDLLALSADGSRLVRTAGTTTTVSTVSGTGLQEEAVLTGEPLSLAGDVLVLHHCEEADADACHLSGYDLTADDTAAEDPAADDTAAEDTTASDLALWTLSAPAQMRGADSADVEVDARPEQEPDLLDAIRATGVLPAVALRFDPAQGWTQLDPTTGFPVGRVLAGPQQECRITATGPAPSGTSTLQAAPVVLTVCSAADGALTATATQDGELFWESEPSPAGSWSVRMDQGRVLATGTEEGTDTVGELIASEQQAAWTAPGGKGLAQASPAVSRIGIDGARMVLANGAGQLVAYDAADGTNTWTLPLTGTSSSVRGMLDSSSVVVLDPVERTEPLQPRGAQRLRVIDAATGTVTAESVVTREVRSMQAVGGGRALVTVGGTTVLLGA